MPRLVLETVPLGFMWPTLDPFLFCVHHDDAYPAGNAALGPAASLDGRELGSDFAGKDGWRMYHGEEVPGFPAHPHRGFETVTLVRRGLIDHSDSLGATARFGGGDVQWLTAGHGIVHCEMFPLLAPDAPNPVELFQLWLNLPAADKHAEPHFAMLWRDQLPRREADGAVVTVVAGAWPGLTPPPAPPPKSWASRPDSHLAIWTIALQAGASVDLPPAPAEVLRMLYFFDGEKLTVGDEPLATRTGARLDPTLPTKLTAGGGGAQCLVLQARPIGEPVAQHGPFVMNTREEIQQAFADYRRTEFGGWPWPRPDPVHPREQPRFARHADGRIETATP